MTIDKQALRQKAVKAGGEEWQSRKMPGPAGEYTVIVKGSLEKHPGWTTCRPVADEVIDKKTMDFIAAANPATVLALLDELEHYKSREERVTKLVLDNSTSWDAFYKKLEAANRRSAELDRDCWTYENTVKTLLERAESAESACTEAARILKSGERLALTRAVNILLSVGECATSYQYPVVLPEPIGWKSPSGHEVLKKKDVIAALMSAGVPVEGD
ncbi:ead/Ea22-like family protein [Salmonella enterica subsp. enterica serovar Derby]|nr:ead/Ea22-like family protein [Salmonella enterica subsp. enterica serovar Derby]